MPDVEMQEEQQQQLAPAYAHATQAEGIRSGNVPKPGRSAQRRQKALQAVRKRLDRETRRNSDGVIEGPLRPCTLVNFNPLPLVAYIEGRRITVPAPSTAAERFQIRITHGGRKFVGAYACFTNPIMYTPVSGHEVDEVMGNVDVAKTEVRYYTPHAIGCLFWNQYNSPSTKLMGGLLLFDQEPRALSSASLERSGGRILVPEQVLIEDAVEWSYTVRDELLQEEIERIFETQLGYCNTVIQNAHTLWSTNDPGTQAMITDTDRNWARYAHEMNLGLETLPAWVTAKLKVGSTLTELAKCRYCQTQAIDPTAHFCHKCNAPYDAYRAFKAGLSVPMQYLELLEGAQFDEVAATLHERASKRKLLQPFTTETVPAEAPAAASKKLTGAAAASAAKRAAAAQGKEE